MNLYRCNNSKCRGAEFEAEEPVCPGCKVDARIPKYAHVIQQLEILHFNPPDLIVPELRLGTMACDPTKSCAGHWFTNVPSVVNCRACRATQVWKDAFHPPSPIPPQDHVVTVEAGALKLHGDG